MHFCKLQLLTLVVVILTPMMIMGEIFMSGVHNLTRIKTRLPPSIVFPRHDITQYAFEDNRTIRDQFQHSGIPTPKDVIVKKIVTSKRKEVRYRMHVTNDWGMTLSGILTVKFWDKPDDTPLNISITREFHLSLPCLQNTHYIREVNHSITWYRHDLHGDTTLNSDKDKYYIDLNGTLHIFNATNRDASDYFCNITAMHGDFSFNASLKRRLIKSSPRNITLLTTTPTSNLNHRVVRDIHEDSDSIDSDHTTTTTTPSTTTTTPTTTTTTTPTTTTTTTPTTTTTTTPSTTTTTPTTTTTTTPTTTTTTTPTTTPTTTTTTTPTTTTTTTPSTTTTTPTTTTTTTPTTTTTTTPSTTTTTPTTTTTTTPTTTTTTTPTTTTTTTPTTTPTTTTTTTPSTTTTTPTTTTATATTATTTIPATTTTTTATTTTATATIPTTTMTTDETELGDDINPECNETKTMKYHNGSCHTLNIFYITESRTYVYGSTVILECLCSGDHFPSVNWEYAAKHPGSTGAPIISSKYSGRRLEIADVRDNIDHTYTCICNNNTTRTMATTTFKVEPLLEWLETSSSVNVSERANVTFKCLAHWSNGKKVSTNTLWYFNNITLDLEKSRQKVSSGPENDPLMKKTMQLYDYYPAGGNPEIHYWLSNDMTTMLFTNISWSNAMNIQCRLEENNQSLYHSLYLNVFARTEINLRYTMDKQPNTVKIGVNVFKDPLRPIHTYTVTWSAHDNKNRTIDLHDHKNRYDILVNINNTRDVTCIVSNEYESISRSVLISDILQNIVVNKIPEQTISDADWWLGLFNDVGWIAIIIVIIIVVSIIVTKKWRWIKRKWKYRKQRQSIRFRMALQAATRSSNKYIDIHRNKDEFPIDRLRFLDVIGEGNFGKVMKAEALDINGSGTWDLVAVKMWKDTATDSFKESFYHEMMMMRKVPKYMHVVAYFGYSFKSDPAFIIMEFIPGGDLLTFLRKRRPESGKNKQNQETVNNTALQNQDDSTHVAAVGDVQIVIPEDDADEGKASTEVSTVNLVSSRDLASFAMQICRGMAHLANNNIIHRDVAARNVLIGVGNVCKISDLGLARDVEGCDAYERSSMGPLPIRWMPPEALKDGLYTYKSDVWSFGVVLWEIVTLGASPYSGMSARQVMTAVTEGKRLEKPAFCSDVIYDIMADCWQGIPDNRPTFCELTNTIEKLLEQEAEYIQLDDYEEGIYNVIDPNEVGTEEEKI